MLLYAGLFCASILLLFGTMFWLGTNYFTAQIDDSVSKEILELDAATKGQPPGALQGAVASYAKDAPDGVYYLLQDKNGRFLSGNLPPLAPVPGVRSWPDAVTGAAFPAGQNSVRGRGIILPDRAYLFVGLDSQELDKMRDVTLRTFVWGLVGAMLLAVVGGAVMSLGLLRRVEAISRTSHDIFAGDLARRIELQGTDDEFDHLATSLNAMLDRIHALMEGLRQVSNDIAHDLRTPLSRLRQRLEFARRRSNSVDELRAALDSSIADVDGILDTFSALLRIAQIEAHTNAAGMAPLDLSDLLNDTIETYTFIAEERGQQLSGRIQAGLTVIGDRELLPQLFTNLIENAIRHCTAGASIAITAEDVPAGIKVVVADNGPGIPAELHRKVFERFFRLEHSRTTEGTGLGLTLAGAIAALHEARIELSDNGPGLRAQVVFAHAPRQGA